MKTNLTVVKMVSSEKVRYAMVLVTLLTISIISGIMTARQITNSMNVKSSDPERVKILDFGFDDFGAINMSFQVLKPWDIVFVSQGKEFGLLNVKFSK